MAGESDLVMPDQPPTPRGKGWGGARPGPHPGAPRRYIRFELPADIRRQLEAFAATHGTTAAEAARETIIRWLDEQPHEQ